MNNGNQNVQHHNERYNLRPRRAAQDVVQPPPPPRRANVRRPRGQVDEPEERPRPLRHSPPRRRQRVDSPPRVINRRGDAFFPFPIGLPDNVIHLNDTSDDDDDVEILSNVSSNDPSTMSDDDDEEDGSDNDSDEDSDEGEEANPFLDPESEEENVWHPLGDFPLNLDLRGDLHNFIDVFRRITYGLNATRSSIHLDTLPLPSPQDWGKVDLYRHTMPAQGAIPMHRNYLLQPFANVIIDTMPTQMHRRHIFISSYTRECWDGLQDGSKSSELRLLKSRLWCTVETAKMIQRYYPALYIEIRDLLYTLIPNKMYQIRSDEPSETLSVMALPLDTIPGACMYLMSKDSKFLLHTGCNAGQDSYQSIIEAVNTWAPTIDTLYLDSALYFPRSDSSFRQKLEARSMSFLKIESFILSKVSPEYEDAKGRYFTIQFKAGMEEFLKGMVQWAKIMKWKVGLTEDLYEWSYGELFQSADLDSIVKIDYLDIRYLENPKDIKIFFYTELCSDYNDLYMTNNDHYKLHVIYDYHSSLERVREPRLCGTTIYRKSRAFNNDSSDYDQNYFALYPSHPNTKQVKHLIKHLQPCKILGLARAPGVGYTELKDEFKKLSEEAGNSPRVRMAQTQGRVAVTRTRSQVRAVLEYMNDA